MLPRELGGIKLRRRAFTGKLWLKARPEENFSPEVNVDSSTFLESLGKQPSDLTAAWAVSGAGPKVVAYHVRMTSTKRLVAAYVHAIRRRARPTKIRITQRVLWGKRVTITSRGLPTARGYLYAKSAMLFTAWTDHITPRELDELLQELP
jgi:hypothetical protein